MSKCPAFITHTGFEILKFLHTGQDMGARYYFYQKNMVLFSKCPSYVQMSNFKTQLYINNLMKPNCEGLCILNIREKYIWKYICFVNFTLFSFVLAQYLWLSPFE